MVTNQTWLVSLLLSIFCRQVVFSLWVGHFRLCSLCSSFPFVCTFLSEDLSFPAAFFGFVSTFAGAGLADNLADPLLGSSFAAPSAELPFLSGLRKLRSLAALNFLSLAKHEQISLINSWWSFFDGGIYKRGWWILKKIFYLIFYIVDLISCIHCIHRKKRSKNITIYSDDKHQVLVVFLKLLLLETSLAVQWLRLCASTAGGCRLNPWLQN